MTLTKDRVVIASDVSDRDGIGAEIFRDDKFVIEIFRYDTKRTRTVTPFQKEIPWDFIVYANLNPDYAVEFLLLSKTPLNTRTCSFRVLTVEVTMAARPKLARVLVFFGVLNIMNEIDCIIRVKRKWRRIKNEQADRG